MNKYEVVNKKFENLIEWIDECMTLTAIYDYDSWISKREEIDKAPEDFIALYEIPKEKYWDGRKSGRDILMNYYWNAGPLTKRFGYFILRDNKVKYYCCVWLS